MRRSSSVEEIVNHASQTPRPLSYEIKEEPIVENSQTEQLEAQHHFNEASSIQSETDEEELEMFRAIDNVQTSHSVFPHDHSHQPGPSHQMAHEMHTQSNSTSTALKEID